MPSQIITLILGLLCVVSVLGYGYAKGKLLRGSGDLVLILVTLVTDSLEDLIKD